MSEKLKFGAGFGSLRKKRTRTKDFWQENGKEGKLNTSGPVPVSRIAQYASRISTNYEQ